MIKITAEKGRITLSGHAGYAEKGKGIVCAAVSILTFKQQESINKLTEDTVGFSYALDETVISYDEVSDKTMIFIDSFIAYYPYSCPFVLLRFNSDGFLNIRYNTCFEFCTARFAFLSLFNHKNMHRQKGLTFWVSSTTLEFFIILFHFLRK